jgi:hypothetical protein
MMGQVRKDNVKGYTNIFTNNEQKSFQSNMASLAFSDNSQLKNDSSRLFKTEPVYEYLLRKFRLVYSPGQELSLDEGMILRRGRLRFRAYNPAKLTKCGILV